jgi:hypothetical protein
VAACVVTPAGAVLAGTALVGVVPTGGRLAGLVRAGVVLEGVALEGVGLAGTTGVELAELATDSVVAGGFAPDSVARAERAGWVDPQPPTAAMSSPATAALRTRRARRGTPLPMVNTATPQSVARPN